MRAFFLLLGLVLGFGLGFSLSLGDYILVIVWGLLFVPFLFLSFSKKQIPFFLVAFVLGILLGFLHLPIDSGKREVTGIVIKSSDNYYVVFAEWRRYYVYEKNSGKEVGDILKIVGNIREYSGANYESRFDFGAYLNRMGTYGEISASKVTYVFENPIRIRAYEDWFVSGLSENAKGLTYSALFNRKDYQNDLVSLADELNLVFAISSSGLLYGWLLKAIEKRLKWKLSDEKAELIVFFLSLVFLIPGFSKIGIRRVFLRRGFGLLNRYVLKERLDSITLTCLPGLVMIALNRYTALETGLWIGTGISLIFILSGRFIHHGFSFYRRFLVRYILLRLCLLPLTLAYNNGRVPILSGIYAQILLPFTYLYQLLGYLCMVFVFARGILNPLADGYFYMLKGFSYLNPTIDFPTPTPFFYVFYYVLLIAVLTMTEVGLKKTPALLGLGGFSIYLASLLPYPIWFTDQVSFINVGQGDSILIRDNDNVVLLDTGGVRYFDMAEEVLIPYFRKQRIDHIDYLIASHGDYDHIGAKESLEKNFKVGKYISSHHDFPLKVGELEFYSYNDIEESSDENDKSLVLSLKFMGKKWIFTGDAPSFVEKNIVGKYPNLDCDILKVGHHGSSTSTCAEWLDCITPEVAVISVGRNNSYGHPEPSVMNRLTERGIKIRRTDLEGTITYRTFSFISV